MRKKTTLHACIALLMCCAYASAETIYVSPSGKDTNDGSSWSKAFKTVQSAIYAAYPGDDVWIAAGTYYPTETIYDEGSNYTPSVDLSENPHGKSITLQDGVNLYGGFAGNETSLDARAKSDLNGNGLIEPWEFTNQTILTADFNGDDKWTLNEDGTWTIEGMAENSFHVIWVPIGFADIITLDGLTVQGGGCTASVYAGLHAVHKNAGGLSTNGNGTTGSDLLIQNCLFQNNYAWTNGGAMQIQYGGNTKIKNCCFRNNKASNQAGAIRNQAAVIEDTWFYRNEAMNGGAVYNNGGASLLDRCLVASNVSATTGGAVLLGGQAKNCAIFNNQAQQGGGFYATGSGARVTNCTVANNIAFTENGGEGIFNNTPANMIINTLFWENKLQGGSVSNSAFTNSGILYQGDETCVNNILINTQSQVVNPTDFKGVATNNTQLDKILKSNWRLVEGSALINAGAFDIYVTANSLYNIPRNDEIPDIGAAEYDESSSSIATFNAEKVLPVISNNILILCKKYQSVKLYDVSGKIALTGQNTDALALGNLAKGMYICILENAGNRYSVKIVF